jgi:hypothetical protein
MNSYVIQTKEWLEEKGHITSWEAIQEMGNTRLSATIYILRHNYEMPIEMELRTAANGKRFGYYYLRKED